MPQVSQILSLAAGRLQGEAADDDADGPVFVGWEGDTKAKDKKRMMVLTVKVWTSISQHLSFR